MSADPAVRYAAGAVLLSAFLAALAIVVHGFWFNPEYVIPGVVNNLLAIAIGSSASLLGVHVGQVTTQSSVKQGAEVARAAQNGGQDQGGSS